MRALSNPGFRRLFIGVLAAVVALAAVVTQPAAAGPVTPTVTSLTRSLNPSAYGEAVTFTVHVTPNPMTGQVSIYDGATLLTTVGLNRLGVATFQSSTMTTGTHVMTADFLGWAPYAPSTSVPVTQTVHQGVPTMVLTASPAPSNPTEQVTFRASVTPPGTGTVTFWDGGTNMGSSTLNASSVATFNTNSLTVGSHSVYASYAGDANLVPYASDPITHVVRMLSTTTFSISPNPTSWGTPVTLHASVSPIGATGTVMFRKDDGTILGQCQLNSSVCSITSPALAAGSHSLQAYYIGDSTHAASLGMGGLAISKVTSTTALAPASAVWGDVVHLTAQVHPSGVTGTVVFSEGATHLGTTQIGAAGTATLPLSGLGVGSHPITATYSGDHNATASASTAQITIAPVTTSLHLSASPSPAPAGTEVTLTARTLPESAPGSVTVTEAGVLLGACTLNHGACSLTTASLAVGRHSISASYVGDSQHTASTATAEVEITAVIAEKATLKAVAHKSKLRLKVTPPCSTQYGFTIQTRVKHQWVTRSTAYRTKGGRNTRTVNLPKGTYRVVVDGACGRQGVTTKTVRLSR